MKWQNRGVNELNEIGSINNLIEESIAFEYFDNNLNYTKFSNVRGSN